MSSDRQPLIVAVAPNGAYKSKSDHSALPITSRELANTAAACLDAGATMIHLHVRDNQGRHSLEPDHYRSAIAAIQKSVGDRLAIQVTSEAGGRYHSSDQIAAIRALKPRAVSVALREYLPDDKVYEAADFFAWLSRESVLAQYILFNTTDVQRYQSLRQQGVIPESPHWVLFVLGRYARDQQSEPRQCLPFLDGFEWDVPWAVCAFGKTELDCVTFAAIQGGHVRVGFENNLLNKGGTVTRDNTEQVTQVVQVADALGYPLATAESFREQFGGWG